MSSSPDPLILEVDVQSVSEDTVPMHVYSAALDEIHQLRVALAIEARTMETIMTYRTVPKTLVDKFKLAIVRCRESARGNVSATYAPYPDATKKYALKLAGANQGLTRHQFEESVRAS